MSCEENELILKAKESIDEKVLIQLANSPYTNVRRCVAKNRSTPVEIINKLAYDPVLNVSVIALNRHCCEVKRDVDFQHPCVLCDKDESTLHIECSKDGGCLRIKKYYEK